MTYGVAYDENHVLYFSWYVYTLLCIIFCLVWAKL